MKLKGEKAKKKFCPSKSETNALEREGNVCAVRKCKEKKPTGTALCP